MNTQGKVNKMLFSKSELSTYKVELGLADDIKGLVSQIKANIGLIKTGDKEIKAYRKRYAQLNKETDAFVKAMEKLYGSSAKFYDKGKKLITKSAQAAKELGVDPKNIDGYNELEDSIMAVDEAGVDMIMEARTIY